MPTVKEYQKQREKEKIAYDYFIGQGYSPQASAGIVGNLIYESGLNTSAEGDIGYKGGSSFGIAQFRGQRLVNLKKRYGNNWTDFNNQLDYIKHELATTHSKADAILRGTVDVYEAGQAFSDLFEIPAKKYKDNKDRQEAVNSLYGRVAQPITTEVIDYSTPNTFTNFTTPPVNLNYELPEKKEDSKVIEAKESLQQQTNEYNFLTDFLNNDIQLPQISTTIQSPVQQSNIPGALQRYAEVSQIVGTPSFQQGGTYEQDRQWLQNWYENRGLNTVEYNEDKPYFTELSQFIPDPTIVDTIDSNPDIKGQYDPETNNITITNTSPNGTYLHEATHRTQNFTSAMRPIHRDLVNQNVKLTGDYANDAEYYTDPDEIHARIQVLRNRAGIQPNQTVTPEFLQNFFKNYQNDNGNINDLREITDEQGLLNLLNGMAARDNNINMFYAQQGGQIPVSSLGMYKYPNQQVVVPSNSITMKNINYPVLGKSLETGEQKIMMPNLEYYFNNTKNVLEIPLK